MGRRAARALRAPQLRPGAGDGAASALDASAPTSPTSSRCAARSARAAATRCRRPSIAPAVDARLPRARRRVRRTADRVQPAAGRGSTAGAARFDCALAPQSELDLARQRRPATTTRRGRSPTFQRRPLERAAGSLRARARGVVRDRQRPTSSSTTGSTAAPPTCAMMITETPHGPYPYAGVPWFSTPFGRDGIITALECLWIDPALARGVLSFLAATQATRGRSRAATRARQDPARDAVGRDGGARRDPVRPLLRQSSTRRRSSSMLAAAYYERTGDLALHPAALAGDRRRALGWIDRDGDLDGDGFVEYARAVADRARAAGLEGLARRRLSRRRHGWPRRRSRSARCRATSTRRGAAPRRWRRALGRARRGPRTGRRRRERAARRASRRRSGASDSAPTCSRSTARSGRARCDRRTPATCCSPASPRRERAGAVARHAAQRRELLRLGHPHARDQRGALQPDVVPQRIGLAARQRADRRRAPRATASQRGAARARRDCSTPACRCDLHRLPELFCGFARRPRRGPDALSGRLRAAGVGGGVGVLAAAGGARPRRSTARTTRCASRGRCCRRSSTTSSSAGCGSARRASTSASCVTSTTSASACCGATATSKWSRSSRTPSD